MIVKINKEEALNLYLKKIVNDFPADEIPSYNIFEKLLDAGLYSCYEYDDKGYLVIRECEKIVFIMVLAINQNERGKGYGKHMLTEFKKYFKDKRILLEAENPEVVTGEEKILREKRIKFYLSLGYKVTPNLKYILAGVDYKILYLDKNEVSTKEIIENMSKIYKEVLRNTAMLEMQEIN